MTVNEGSKVAYVGDDVVVGVGSVGRVLSSAGSSQHVQWLVGSRQGEVDLIPNEDLVPHRGETTGGDHSVTAQFDASLAVPSMVSVAVRDTYDAYGEEGLLNALDEAGHLATLSEYANDAIATVAGRLRKDPTFSAVLAQLDDYEAESLLVRVAVSLLAPATEED